MTLANMATLFVAMALLAAVPSVSVLTVAARSATSGFIHGAAASMGVVTGDIIFILVAIFGLAMLAEAMGDMFILIRYLGGAYLIWLGITLWRFRDRSVGSERRGGTSLLSSFMAGLLITLGDQKAILFYLGFLPAFMDLTTVTWFDAGIVILIAAAAVGGVKLAYAYMADRTGAALGSGTGRVLDSVAAVMMCLVGAFLIVGA